MGETLSQPSNGLEAGPASRLQRKKALFALLVVTSVWGATFIWMKQALNSLDAEIIDYGRFQVVAILVAARFTVAALAMVLIFPKARAALNQREQWRGGFILGGIMLVGFVTQMIGLEDISPSVSAFLTSLYVVFTALITVVFTKSRPSRYIWCWIHSRPSTSDVGAWRDSYCHFRGILRPPHYLYTENNTTS